MLEPEEYLDQLIVQPINQIVSNLGNMDSDISTVASTMPNKINEYPEYLRSIAALREKIKAVQFTITQEHLTDYVMGELNKEKAAQLEYSEDAMAKLIDELNETVDRLQRENAEYNKKVYAEVESKNSIFTELKEKHETLLGYSSTVTDLCTRYNITATDINIDETTLKPQKLNKLYDEYIKYLRNTKESINPITLLKMKVVDVRLQVGIIAVAIAICFTPVLSILSLVFVVGVIYAMKSNAKKSKYYSVLQALLYNVNPDHLSHAVVDQSKLLPEHLPIEDDDAMKELLPEYPELQVLWDRSEELQAQTDVVEEKSDEEQQAYMAKYSTIVDKAITCINDGESDFNRTKDALLAQVDNLENTAQSNFQKLKDEYKGFGSNFIEDGAFNTNLTLGINEFIEEYVDIGEKNVIIREGQDKALLESFLKCLFVNAITHVNYTKLCTYIVDPNGMGQTIMPFYRSDLENRIKIVQKDIGNVISEFAAKAQKNLELTQGESVQEYNRKCQALNRDTIEYNLLFVLSQSSKVEETESLNSLFQYSTKAGILIWVVSDTLPATNDTHVFRFPFEGVKHPIREQDNRDWCAQVAQNYIDAINNYKPPSLDWDKFMSVACTPDKQWTFNADDNMYLYPGFQNGDPALCKDYPLGNGGNVHALGVGTTGAGKSIFIHHIIQTLCEMYSPRELQLWLCDFKGTEFKFYMASGEFPYTLPHIKACLCTSDGDYATSVFHAVRVITDNRFEQMKNPNEHRDWLKYDDHEEIPNFDNAKNWNRYWRQKAKETEEQRYIDNCYPRVFLVSDEFQVIFQTASDKNLESIKSDMTQISKLGRAANVHMFFTSQSMKGTLSSDILNQFSLRFALRCTEDVAQDIMGTPYAAQNLPKFGGLYVSATGIKKEDQPKFATPFISPEQIHTSTKQLAERAIAENMPKNDLITYEEATKHPIAELDKFYDELDKEGKIPDKGTLMVIGERMAYSENKAPDNFIVTKKNNENIYACFSDYTDYVFMFETIMKNIEHCKENSMVIINTQVEDLAYLIDAGNRITNKEAHGELLYESCMDVYLWLDKVIKSRMNSGKDTPIWVFLLGWDKGTGFGVDCDLSLRSKMNSVLQQCGVYNIHIVFFTLATAGMSQATINACKYILAGKCTLDDSMTLLGTKQAGMNYEMRTGWVFVKRDGAVTRDKLYISDITREIEASELKL